ncbi:MAG: octaprenyl diphosphate synthase, partial [Gammaproteobacteria bacterium]|nr:octaprenyl diphosphate synthase [Gammaproteobacteria bacterium]
MNIEQIKALIADDMAAVDALIQARLASDVVLVNQLSHY